MDYSGISVAVTTTSMQEVLKYFVLLWLKRTWKSSTKRQDVFSAVLQEITETKVLNYCGNFYKAFSMGFSLVIILVVATLRHRGEVIQVRSHWNGFHGHAVKHKVSNHTREAATWDHTDTSLSNLMFCSLYCVVMTLYVKKTWETRDH